ncbi:intercellular adhesion molecule 1-like [Tiliqua scincoides]|uniref:intercellular adhesion molecule 1-like n=1 Tax=Tiliqua scincoides TaxID=71010 RepID=UPI003462C875
MQRLLVCLLLAAVASGAQERLFVGIEPEKPMVEFGGFIVINCTTNCEFSSYGIETSLLKQEIPEKGTSWRAFRLGNVTEWTPRALCYFVCEKEDEDLEPQGANITVYRAPNHVVLDPLPEVEVGKKYNLTCRVSDVAPIRNVTVTFLRGGEKLYQETFEEHSNATAGDLVVTHSLMAQRADHGMEFSCQAALDLRPEAELFEKASYNQSLKIVVFPVDPHLQTSENILETNTEMPVECNVVGIFPVEEAQFDLTFAGESLNFSTSMSGNRVTAHALVSSSSAGEHELNCAVSLGPVTRTAAKTVHIYSLPEPILNVDHQEILVNETATFMCSSQGTEAPGTKMQIRTAKQVLIYGRQGSLQVSVTAQEEDDGREFTCEVLLIVDGQRVLKSTSVKLSVFYGPQMNDSSCPNSLTWKDGSEEIFICSAWGNPAPTVECSKDKIPYAIGIQQPITKEQDGIYQCNATNMYGSIIQYVTVHVESYQFPTLAVSLAALITVAVTSAVIMAYRMYYQAHKIRKYHLKNQQEGGTAMEEKCLNGNAPLV